MAKRKPGRPAGQIPEDRVLSEVVSVRLDSRQLSYVDQAVRRVNMTSPVPVTRTWIIKTLVDFGRAAFEKKYLRKRSA